MAEDAIRLQNWEIGNCPQYSFLTINLASYPLPPPPFELGYEATINHNDLKETLTKPNLAVTPAVCAVSLCALILVLLPPLGRGISSRCFAY
jgi:hypothetical protein